MSPRWGERGLEMGRHTQRRGAVHPMGKKAHKIQRRSGERPSRFQTKTFMNPGTKVLPKGDYYSLPGRIFQSILQVMSSTVFLK